MRTCYCIAAATALMVAALIGTWPAPALAYNIGDTTVNWTMLDGSQTISHNLYDYQGKLVLVNLFSTT
ncbi:hypothetical protein AMJ39_07955 [candidate division TA06 bacterium DG_24]|uniref:Alkyl hydroperoxide reductase subunit C/ Thiol specific antioxidant domain-containing protein n=1 Tax=candidate division TA06 bacterium DG_24 TaxID=1703770 RepID=A0A0S7WQB9_UNCT6|nr:MAG: hypothetical protein AMJ39_07955 [candidate division TA06 bacterium DG_24]